MLAAVSRVLLGVAQKPVRWRERPGVGREWARGRRTPEGRTSGLSGPGGPGLVEPRAFVLRPRRALRSWPRGERWLGRRAPTEGGGALQGPCGGQARLPVPAWSVRSGRARSFTSDREGGFGIPRVPS